MCIEDYDLWTRSKVVYHPLHNNELYVGGHGARNGILATEEPLWECQTTIATL